MLYTWTKIIVYANYTLIKNKKFYKTYLDVYSSFIQNIQNIEPTNMLFNSWMNNKL